MKKVTFWATSMGRRERREATYADNEYADMGRLKALIEKAEPGSPLRAALMLEMENLHTLRCEFPLAPAWQVDVVEIAQRKAEAAARAAAEEAPVAEAAAKPVATDPAPSLLDEAPSGRYSGPNPTETERESGSAIEARGEDDAPLRKGGAAHMVLAVYVDGQRLTAYEASHAASLDWHAKRRESTRLLEKGFLVKSGTKPNLAPAGRPHVDAFVITEAGLAELRRLGES